MTIAIEVQPELEQKIVAAAERHGVTVEAYLTSAAEEKVKSEPRGPRTLKAFEEFLDAMAYHGPVPDEMKTQAITRAFIYGDHA